MPQVQPYLMFNGRCQQAVDYYCKTLGAEVDMLMRVKDAPEPEPGMTPDKLMHACFRGGLKSPKIVQEGVNEATILSLVSCGLGVAFVSAATRWRCPESVVLVSVSDLKLPLPFALLWRKDDQSPLLLKFLENVRRKV
jgi:DNA-binding transcriptional LysR family regulator